MSHSQPPGKPRGARQRTGESARQSSVNQSGSEASYSVAEDGRISSDLPNQGAALSRNRRRGAVPPRSDTRDSLTSESNIIDSYQYSDTPDSIVDNPYSDIPTSNRSHTDISRYGPRTQRSLGVDAPHLYSSPAQSMASLERGSEHEEPRGYPSASANSSRGPSSLSGTVNPSPSTSYREYQNSIPSTMEGRNERTSSRQQSTSNENFVASDDQNSSNSKPLSKWSTIRRAVHQTPPPPPVPELPTNTSSYLGLRVTPASSSVSGSLAHGSAVGFSIPRTGSAMSSLSDAGLGPPPSTVSSNSSNITTNSRSAKAVMGFRNAVDHARTNVAGMGSGLGGMGMGRGALGGFTGGFGRGAGAANAAVQRQVMEDDSPFAKEILQACWVARFGTPTGGKGASSAGNSTIGSNATTGLRRPMRKATTDGGPAIGSASGTNPTAATAFSSPQNADRGSLKLLQHLIINQASILSSQNQRGIPTSYFPHQGMVLSALLSPFLGTVSDERDKREAENEQWIAVEIYELFTKNWPGYKRPQEEVERWLWCCHAAAQESASTTVRPRLLLALELALSAVRSGNPQIRASDYDGSISTNTLTPLSSFRTLEILTHSLFLIYPRVHGYGSETALSTLNSILSKLQRPNSSGVIGELELGEIEINFGARGIAGETGDDYRTVILTSSAINLLAMGSESSRKWYLLNFLEV